MEQGHIRLQAGNHTTGQISTDLGGMDDADIIDVGKLLRAIWARKFLIALGVILGMVIGWFYAEQVASPVYRAKSVLLLDPQAQTLAGLVSASEGISGDVVTINSEVQVLRSRILMGRVVDQLGLTKDPEFNTSLQELGFISKLKNDITRFIGRDVPERRVIDPTSATAHEIAVNRLLQKVEIVSLSLTRVFEVRVESNRPKMAALLADTIADVYISSQIQSKYEATEAASTWLASRVGELQIQLEEAQARARTFSSETDLISAETLSAIEVQIKDLRDRINTLTNELRSSEAQVVALEAASTINEKLVAANDTLLNNLANGINEEGEEGQAQAFDTHYAQILTRTRRETTRMRGQLTALTRSLPELQARFQRQSEDLIQLQQLTREAEVTRLLYETFLTSLKETSVQEGLQQADSRLLSYAIASNTPIRPKASLLQAAGGAMGFMIASILVLVRELTSQSFRNVSQLEAFTGRTVMGQVPLLKTYKRDETLTYLSRNPTSAPSEAVHNMQTSIRMLNIDQPPQVIMLTSCVPGEGKTTLSLALAHSLASLGRRVLVVEGDVRRNVMRPHFPNVTAQGSIMDVLSGDKTPEEGVTPINVNGVSFDLLFGAKHTSNAMNIFASTRFSEMIKQLRELYDVVVIDTPPVLVVPDARAIAPHSDALIMVVKWDSTTRQQVAEGIRMFSSINLPISGFVLNQISPVGMKRYGYGSEYGAYSNYGSKYYSNSG